MERRDVFVVIPAFNEGSTLRSVVSDVLGYGYQVVVVDDGSAIPAFPGLTGLDVFVIRHAVNLGQGAALRTGSEFALSKNAGVVVHFDADGQHDAALIERLISPLVRGEAEVALGSRFIRSSDRRLVPFGKRLLLKTAVAVSWAFTGLWLTDTHNGLRALSRKAAERIRLEENGFAHATEILDSLRRSRLRFIEVPVAIRYTEYSRSKGQSMWNSFNIVFDLMLRRLFH